MTARQPPGGDPVTSSDESVDVVDEQDRVTATATRREVRHRNLRHRTVSVVVVTSADEIVVHRRAEWKDVWPGFWDIAFGGVVGHGELWGAAARRELHEEAGIDGKVVPLGQGRYEDDTVREISRVFGLRSDGPFRFADGEVVEIDRVARSRVVSWAAARELCPDTRSIVLPLLAGDALWEAL